MRKILFLPQFQLPNIKFDKYNVPVPSFGSNSNHKSNPNATSNLNQSSTSSPNSAVNPSGSFKTKEENDFTVRGRVFDQSKPETFNQV